MIGGMVERRMRKDLISQFRVYAVSSDAWFTGRISEQAVPDSPGIVVGSEYRGISYNAPGPER